MGFYGNITNTSKTQFQFDLIYSNRRDMERATLTDGVYLGRHVLIEYDHDGRDGMKEVTIGENNKFYYGIPSPETLLTTLNTEENEVVYRYEEKNEVRQQIFYISTGNVLDTSDNAVEFKAIASQDTNATQYMVNYNIDLNVYQSSRGYDSTVWQKVYANETEQYVMIAELNTVVPKFDIATDAPTMTPIAPHFDTQSTDVYYKLHMQNPWVVRVAEAKESDLSDAKIKWQEVIFDEKANIGEQYKIKTIEKDGAIYFNKAAFAHQVGKNENEIDKTVSGENKITVDLVSSGHKIYDDHDKATVDLVAANDIQELTINLPAIGNMMSDAWDIIHGPNRDNARTDENGSLQGRLDSFKEIKENQIPVKRSIDGTLIGSKINSALNYDSWDDKPDEILNDDGVTPEFVRDDAWIETVVDTSDLAGGVKNGDLIDQSTNSGISIHHTFHATQNSTSSVDKNDGSVAIGDNYKQAHIRSTNSHHNNDDKIDLYVPYVDAKGHVVGHNIETVTLPYGFKTITTNGRSDEVSENATGTPVTAEVVADTTQDTLEINSGNKWIRIDTNATGDSVTIRHDVHTFDDDKTDSASLSNETSETVTFDTVTYDFDNAGHFTGKTIKTLTMPFGYGKIKGENSTSTAATATYDELTFASDNWLTATVTTDKITYNHDASNPNAIKYTDKENQYPSFGSTFIIEDWAFDEKGHQFNNNKSHTVTVPDIVLNNANSGNVVVGLTLSKAVGDSDKTATFTESKINVGNLALTDYSVVSHTNANGSTDLQPQDTINGAFNKLQAQIYDEEVARANEASRAQEAEQALGERIDALDYSETADNTQIITQITQTNGKITEVARATAGTLVLGSNYSKATTSSALTATDSLNTAFGKVEKSLEDTNKRITDLIGGDDLNAAFDTLKEVSDWLATNDTEADTIIDDIATLKGDANTNGSVAKSINDAISKLDVDDSAQDGQYVSSVSETDGKITVTRTFLPTYTLTSGSTNGTVSFNEVNVAVTGLGTAAYTNSDDYASANILEEARFNFATSDSEDPGFTVLSLSELFTLVADLQAQVITLTEEVENLKAE